jgi:hypothetical protein
MIFHLLTFSFFRRSRFLAAAALSIVFLCYSMMIRLFAYIWPVFIIIVLYIIRVRLFSMIITMFFFDFYEYTLAISLYQCHQNSAYDFRSANNTHIFLKF